MEREFIPSICKPTKDADGKETSSEYSGKVVMLVPNYEQRLELYEVAETASGESIVDKIASGKMTEAQAQAAMTVGASKYGYIKALARQLPKYIKSVSITRLEDGEVFDSFEKMQYDGEMGGVITEMATALVEKYKVGKKN